MDKNFDSKVRVIIKHDRVIVPEIVSDRIDTTLSSLSRNRINFRKKNYLFTVAAVFMVFFVFGLGFTSPAVGQVLKHVPFIGFVFEKAGDIGLKEANKKGLTVPVNQTVSDNGVKITITEVLYDGTRISIGYIQQSMFGLMEIERPNLKVNGKEINFSNSSRAKVIGPTKVVGVINIDLIEALPQSFDLNMTIDAVGIIPGQWDFKFPVKITTSSKSIETKVTERFKDLKLTVDKVILSESTTNLKITIVSPKNAYYIDYKLSDDKNHELENIGATGTGKDVGGMEEVKSSISFSPIKDETEYLVLKVSINPYDVNSNDEIDIIIPLKKQSIDH